MLIARADVDFFFTLNNDMSIFQEEVVMEGTQKYLKGDLNPGTAWYAAINIIVAHVTRSNPAIASQVGPPEEYEKYLYNAMRVIPSLIMLQPANELSIGALLSIVSDRYRMRNIVADDPGHVFYVLLRK